MGREDSINEGRFAQSGLTCSPVSCLAKPLRPGSLTDADDIELKAPFEELSLDLVGDAVEANMALGHHRV